MRLVTLDAPALVGSEPVPLQPLQLALLTYLAVGGPRDRGHLAAVFWQNSANGHNSLSTTLTRIRAMAPDAIWAQGTTVVGSDIESDVTAAQQAAESGDLDRLFDVYRSPFLSLLALRKPSLEFEQWVLDFRSELSTGIEKALLGEARRSLNLDNTARAANLAEAAWRLMSEQGTPTPEYFPGYHRLLSADRRPLARAVESEAAEFGVELPRTEVATPRRTASELTPAVPLVDRHEIIGYIAERAALRQAIEQNRLTTLVGLGGSGKTSLAADYFDSSEAQRFQRRYWVDLTAVHDADLVPAAIAATCGLKLAPGARLHEAAWIADRHLLILDNFEQVTAAAPLIAEFIDRQPNIHAIVTSRTPLGVPAESLIRVGGLSVTPFDGPSPAAQLFETAAARSGASLEPADPAAINEICRLVGGLPLALRLAATWTQMMPPADIAASLRHSSELLDAAATDDGNSMPTIVRDTMATLHEPQLRAVELLAQFPNGCLVASIGTIPGVSLRVLTELVGRSMVVVAADDRRARLHPFVAQQVREVLSDTPARAHELADIQMQWCRDVISHVTADSVEPAARAERLTAELANLEAGWQWSAAQRRWELIDESLAMLRDFFVVSGRVLEGERWFNTALAHASGTDVPPDLLGRLLEATAWATLMSGQPSTARSLLQRGIDLAVDTTPETHAATLRTLGVLEFGAGNVDEALDAFEQAKNLISADLSLQLMTKLEEDIGVCHHTQGRIDDARRAFRANLELGRELQDPHVTAAAYIRLAELEQSARPHRALVLLEEGHTIAREHGLKHLAIYFPLYAGSAHLALGDHKAAKQAFADGLAASREVGHRTSVAASHIGLGESTVSTDPSAAGDHLREGIRVCVETTCMPYLLWAAGVVALLKLEAGSTNPLAVEMLHLALRHPATEPDVRRRLEQAQGRVTGAPAPEPDEAGTGADTARDVEQPALSELAEQLLELLRFG